MSHVISFRLNDEEFKPYSALLNKANCTKTELFKTIFLNNGENNKITIKEKIVATQDYKKTLFVVSKASNNLNQIARKLNIAFKNDVINENDMKKAINALLSIETALFGQL